MPFELSSVDLDRYMNPNWSISNTEPYQVSPHTLPISDTSIDDLELFCALSFSPKSPVIANPQPSSAPTSPQIQNEIPFVCLVETCSTATQWRRGHCRAHGNIKKCAYPGCMRGPQRGGCCITHGGGRRCSIEGCTKAVQTGGLCKSHGGGVRCGAEGCDKSSQGGGFCRKHGGGKRCADANCDKGVQRGRFCARHGGSQYCKVEGCHRTDRGGGFCDIHRKNKACVYPGCMRMQRKNGLCIAHAKRYSTSIQSTTQAPQNTTDIQLKQQFEL